MLFLPCYVNEIFFSTVTFNSTIFGMHLPDPCAGLHYKGERPVLSRNGKIVHVKSDEQGVAVRPDAWFYGAPQRFIVVNGARRREPHVIGAVFAVGGGQPVKKCGKVSEAEADVPEVVVAYAVRKGIQPIVFPCFKMLRYLAEHIAVHVAVQETAAYAQAVPVAAFRRI